MLSICVVTQQHKQIISGIGLHTHNLVARLVADGHRVTVVAPMDQRPQGDLPFLFVGVSPPLFRRTQARWLSLAWSFARRLALLERRDAFDLVHFTDARESLFCRIHVPAVGNVNDTYAADVRSPVYYHRHYADWLLRWGYYRFVKSCEALALPRLQGIIANSHHTANVIAARYRVSRGRLHLCYKSIDPEQYTAAPRFRMQRPAHPPRVLFVVRNFHWAASLLVWMWVTSILCTDCCLLSTQAMHNFRYTPVKWWLPVIPRAFHGYACSIPLLQPIVHRQ